ncbi:sigma 54-interacting transcriptional regulator [Shigella flexneri]
MNPTGKEPPAHALHRHSPRAKAPLLLSMAAIPRPDRIRTVWPREGAFTGANTIRQGRFEQADRWLTIPR